MSTQRWISAVLLAALAVLVGIGLWQTSGGTGSAKVAVVREPTGIMGTSCRLVAVVRRGDEDTADQALAKAQAELSRVEGLMSSWIDRSEISRFNSAAAREPVKLSAETLDVLRAARDATEATGGAFDVTCRPLIELWRKAGQSGRRPTEMEIAGAREETGWRGIQLSQNGAIKNAGPIRVDLGGIAKGYAIDMAVEVMRKSGVDGGMVDVGGDLRCFGRPPDGQAWSVQVRDPFAEGVLGKFSLEEGAVCTSGGYARFTEVAGRRYSHIIDPRDGEPVRHVVSATVVAPTARTADIWATALSVLGESGLVKLPDDVEALVITGDASTPRLFGNGRFSEQFAKR
jgi:thiamine biosynthesis lipoprotein